MTNPVKEQTLSIKTLTVADTEYSVALPSSTRELRFKCRTLYDVRYAWEVDKVATPTDPYATVSAGMEYRSDEKDLTAKILYLASSQAGVVVEVSVGT